MKKWELLHLTLDNSKSYKARARQLLGSNKKCWRQGEFKLSNVNFVQKGAVMGSLISDMSSEFVWSSIFWVFKLLRVNSVNKFPKTFSSTLSKILQNTWRIDFYLFLTSIVVKIETSSKKRSPSKSSRKQNQRKSSFSVHYKR